MDMDPPVSFIPDDHAGTSGIRTVASWCASLWWLQLEWTQGWITHSLASSAWLRTYELVSSM